MLAGCRRLVGIARRRLLRTPWSAAREAEVVLLEVVWVVKDFFLGKLHLQEHLELAHVPSAPAFTLRRHQH